MSTSTTQLLFTYATDAALTADELKGVQGTYNIVRLIRKVEDTSYGPAQVDFPCKSFEEFKKWMANHSKEIISFYPAIHFHPEPEDY